MNWYNTNNFYHLASFFKKLNMQTKLATLFNFCMFCINIVTKNNVFVTLKQSEVINFVKAQASLEMECP